MKRGVFFTALFLGMFLALLGFAVFYRGSVDDWNLYVSEKQAGNRIADAADDVKWDLEQLLGLTTLTFVRANSTTEITVSTNMPSAALDPEGTLATYAAFVSGNYSQRTGVNASLNPSSLAAPSVYFDQLAYNVSWDNASRHGLVAASPSLAAVDSHGTLSANCNGTGGPRCAFTSTSWSWVTCGPGTLNVSLRITDHGGSTVSVNGASSGCVASAAANEFTATAVGGGLTLRAGTVGAASPAFGAAVSGSLAYASTLSANFSYSGPVRALLPVSLSINGRAIGSLVLAEG